MKVFLIIACILVLFVSGCVSNGPVNGNGGFLFNECKSDYIVGGPLQKIGSMETNFNTTCSNMCDDKYKISKFRVDEKTDSFSMCYCDINEC